MQSATPPGSPAALLTIFDPEVPDREQGLDEELGGALHEVAGGLYVQPVAQRRLHRLGRLAQEVEDLGRGRGQLRGSGQTAGGMAVDQARAREERGLQGKVGHPMQGLMPLPPPSPIACLLDRPPAGQVALLGRHVTESTRGLQQCRHLGQGGGARLANAVEAGAL